ncbi:tetratricopeptide repeat protein, partial [Flavobacteriaceae bacterium]|nr:tetratricopeptide repeat protein [Flavobacteriaceae bacterium]
SFSQDYGNNQDVGKLCAAIQANNFTTDSEADNALDQILGVIGASKNFVLQPCSNINNALATSFNGIRYIFYDRDFMNTLNEGNDEGNLFILAHEVGHHINGHTVDWLLYDTASKSTLSNRRKQELEADEFAGFILAKLGGSLSSINKVLVKISNNSDDSFSTHPSRDKRILAAIKGFNKDSNNSSFNNPKENTSQKNKNIKNEILFVGENNEHRWEGPVLTIPASSQPKSRNGNIYIQSISESKKPYGEGVMYYSDGDIYKGAYYNGCPNGYGEMTFVSGEIYKGQWLNCKRKGNGKIIKVSGLSVPTINGVEEGENHYNSGISNYKSENYEEAILEFNKALKFEYDKKDIYYFLGQCYYIVNDYKNGIKYLSLSNKTRPFSYSYYLIGIMKEDEKNYEAAIINMTKSIELDDGDNAEFLSKKYTLRASAKYFSKDDTGDDNGALKDLKKSIELDPNSIYSLRLRGLIFRYLENYNSAIIDYSRLIELDPQEYYYYRRAVCNYYLDNYNESIFDLDKAIQLNSKIGAYYSYRGYNKAFVKDYNGAILDLTKAIELGEKTEKNFRERGVSNYYLKNYDESIIDLTKAIEQEPSYAVNYRFRGEVRYDLKNYQDAILDHSKAITLEPEKANNYQNRARTYYEMKKYQLAKNDATKAIELEPSSSFNYLLRAWHNYKLGDLISGCNDIKEAWKLNPDGEYEEINKLVCN